MLFDWKNKFIFVFELYNTMGCPLQKLIMRSSIIVSPDIMIGRSRRSRWAGNVVRILMSFA
jgi:hypothetical protein